MRFGYKLSSEEHGPRALVANACRAEDSGFDFVALSDHFHPWLEEQGHSPFAWSVLGAIANATEHVGIITAVTCPIVRYHPAVIAQAAATVALLSGGRFSLGVGSGEALNERVVGLGWPHVSDRQDMLREAIEIMRDLWTGNELNFRGEHFAVEGARLFDVPEEPPPIVVAAGGPLAAGIAAECGDALIATEPDAALVEAYRTGGGDGPRYAELSCCWAAGAKEAQRTIHEYARWAGLGWNVLPELASPEAFRDASRYVSVDEAAAAVPHGPASEPYVQAVRKFAEAGFDALILTQVGPDQQGFFEFWRNELSPALADATAKAATT
jgi:G6PDH family F420-dependent oxidoreductase